MIIFVEVEFVLNVMVFLFCYVLLSIQIPNNYEMLIRILHSFLNRSINIIMDRYYKSNPNDARIVKILLYVVNLDLRIRY